MKEATTTRSVDYFNLPAPCGGNSRSVCPKRKGRGVGKVAGRGSLTGLSSTPSGMSFGRDASGRPFIVIGSECPPAWSTNASRSGGRWASSRSS
jgi:hypothetical protein